MQRWEESLALLKEGNRRFAEGEHQHPNIDHITRTETFRRGQEPFAAVLSCADSRVPVEYIFDCGIGGIFSVRNAGNVCDETALGSIELGVSKFNIPLVLVLGHSDCGAVKLALDETQLEGMMGRLIGRIKPAVRQVTAERPQLAADEILLEVTKANAKNTAENLTTQSVILRTAVEKETVRIMPAMYCLEKGLVDFL